MDIGLYKAEVLAMTAGRVDDAPVLVITMRPESRSFQSHNFALSHAQAIRIHRELAQLLFSDPDSWLHIPQEQRAEADEP